MIKRASRHDAPISKGINKIALGFTIIETMLFLAIAGLIFAGLVVGTNGAIRRQRYKDSVQGFVDDLRDLYSLVENTQVLDYEGVANCGSTDNTKTGRGRSNCSVYGIYAIISPTHVNRDNVQAYWVTGVDQALVTSAYTTDLEFFDSAHAQASTQIKINEGHKEIIAKQHSLLWGADVLLPCALYQDKANGCDGVMSGVSSSKNQIVLFIYRSPITGGLNTLTRVIKDGNIKSSLMAEEAYMNGVMLNQVFSAALTTNVFGHNDVSLCVTGGSGMSYDGGIRMVTIDGNGGNTNAVRLIEADSEENKCND